MNPIAIYQFLSALTFNYDVGETQQFSLNINQELIDLLNANSIHFEEQNNQIIIAKSVLPFSFFVDEREFENQILLIHFSKPIVIHTYKNQGPIYYPNNSETNNYTISDDHYISNSKAFLISKDFFKERYHKNDESFEFVDFYSDSSKSITFASINEKRRLKFQFSPTGTLRLNPIIDFAAKFDAFTDLYAESRQFPVFLKKAMIRILLNEAGNKYEAFFEKLDQIILEARLDYNVYLHELSIDKIKAEYKEYKQKYFSSQNEILNKLTNQIIALPLSISGTVFAISKLESNYIPLLIILFGLLSYVGYVTFLIKIYSGDLGSLFQQSSHDYKQLSEQSFFAENPNELIYFQEIKTSIKNRLKDLFLGLKAFILIMWISSSLIIIYLISIAFEISSINQIILISVVISTLLALIHSILFFKKDIFQN